MAICRVLKSSKGWNKGDTVAAFGVDLKTMVDSGEIEIVEPDGLKENLNVATKTEEQIKADKRAYYESHFGKKVKQV